MKKRIVEINRILSGINKKLSNNNFLTRAPNAVIDKERFTFEKLNKELEKITANLEAIK